MTVLTVLHRFLQPLELPQPEQLVSSINLQQIEHGCIPRFTINVTDAIPFFDQIIDPWIRIIICNKGTGIIHDQTCIQFQDVRHDLHLTMNVEYSLLMISESIVFIEFIDRYKINMPSSEEGNDFKKEKLIGWSFLKCSENNMTDDFAVSARLDLLKYQTDSYYVRKCARSLGVSISAPQVYIQYLHKKVVPEKVSITIHVDPTFQSTLKSGEIIFDDEPSEKATSSKYVDKNALDCKVPKKLMYRFQCGGATVLAFSHAGSHIALVTNQHRLTIYELETGTETYRAPYSHQECVNALVWSENDTNICCASKDDTISTYSLQDSNYWNSMKFITLGLDRTPVSLSIINCNPYILIGCSDGSVSIFDLHKTEEVKVLEGHTDKVTAMTTTIEQNDDNESTLDEREISLFSGDASGVIIFWRLKLLQTNHRVSFESQILRKLTSHPELVDKQISNLSIMKSTQIGNERKLLINAEGKKNSLFTYDLVRHEIETFGLHSSVRKGSFTWTIFCPGGDFVSGGTRDGKVILMDCDGIKMEVRQTFQ